MTYNAAGQPLTVTNALSQTTTFTYDSVTANLLTVTGPVSGATTTYTYDGYGRVATVTDGEGTYAYNLDNSVSSTGFTNETIATADLSHTYDAYYPRPLTMVDGNGTTT